MKHHTRGEWKLHYLDDGAFAIDVGDVVLCQRSAWNHRAEESIANGRLMVAAPKLLAFAKRVAEACSFPADAFQKAMRDEARKVIAEAEDKS